MPGKHVRFADDNPPPSATFSTSTLSSSPGPATPPASYYPPLTYTPAYAYPPAHYTPGGVAINPLLVATAAATPLAWDMAEPADSARPLAAPRLTSAMVREPATHPPLPTLVIVCDALPWRITVAPTPHADWAAPYVTVGDVLHTLYRALRLGATEYELDALDDAARGRVLAAYAARYRRIPPSREREAEKAKYVKRVDFLGSHTVFRGLSPVPGGNTAKGLAPGMMWALHVAPH